MLDHLSKSHTFGSVMKELSKEKVHLSIVVWLCVGIFLVYMQIIIGGVTRLTGSGLSITEWEIVTGTIPPLNDASWIEEFNKYKLTPQFEKINQDMNMGSIFTPGTFKFIYFWEFLHRLWARSMGLIFIIPFAVFLYKKMLPKSLIVRLCKVVLLAALAAIFGWLMVASGLVNRPWVNAYKLSLHLCIGISVFMMLWWAFINYIHPDRIVPRISSPPYVKWMLVFLVIQFFLGGVMSGTRAALLINTWPDLNGEMIPRSIFQLENWSIENFNDYEKTGFLVTLIQFLHRGLAYIITGYAFYILFTFIRSSTGKIKMSFLIFIVTICIQVFVGVLTLINSVGYIPVSWGVLHQGIAVIVLASYFLHYFYNKRSIPPNQVS